MGKQPKNINSLQKQEGLVDLLAKELKELAELERREEAGEILDSVVCKDLLSRMEKKFIAHRVKSGMPVPDMKALYGEGERARLAKLTDCTDLSAYALNHITELSPIEVMLIDQFSSCHKLGMKLMGNFEEWTRCEAPFDDIKNLINTSLKLMEYSRKVALALEKIKHGGKQTVVVKHQNIQVSDGAQAVVANEILRCRGGDE